jgi:CP family cyanate transporter-like MFS transporter
MDFSWRQALVWPVMIAIPALILMLPWLAQARNARTLRKTNHAPTGIWRNRIAWLVSGYMGLQSFVFFATMGWLPTYLISEGMSEAQAGGLVALSPLAGVTGSFSGALLVNRRPDQRWLVWISSALCATGIVGFILVPTTLTVIWTCLFGAGCGMILSLALAFIGLRTPDSRHAADLSGMAQTVGYLIAAIGPFGLGLVFDLVGNWTVPLSIVLVVSVIMTIVGLGAARNRLVAPVTEQGVA